MRGFKSPCPRVGRVQGGGVWNSIPRVWNSIPRVWNSIPWGMKSGWFARRETGMVPVSKMSAMLDFTGLYCCESKVE